MIRRQKRMKKFICILSALILVLSLSACQDYDDAISGISNIPEPEPEIEVERYENQKHGIIIEFPKTYERNGNLDKDGFITFDGDGDSLAIYIPDTETDIDEMTAEVYASQKLNLPASPDSGVVTYGKTTGYRTFVYDERGVTVEFVAKGVDGFYRFSFTTNRADFTEHDRVFTLIMASIRIDDGVFISLYKMAKEYTLLLQYVTTQAYVTDADYANHCLNNYDLTGDKDHIDTALATFTTIRDELSKIANHPREEDEEFGEHWVEIAAEAERLCAVCDEAVNAINSGDYTTAKKLVRSQFSFKLSEDASAFISAIQVEVGEYY